MFGYSIWIGGSNLAPIGSSVPAYGGATRLGTALATDHDGLDLGIQ